MNIKPSLRYETILELKASMNNALTRALENEHHYPYRNCLSCSHFTEAKELCNYWQAKPPVRVLVYGCEKHNDISDIPF